MGDIPLRLFEEWFPLQSTLRCPFSLRSNESESKYLCTFSQYGITAG
jgi:hypothetical protein